MEAESLVQKPDDVEALMCARATYSQSMSSESEEIVAWAATLPVKELEAGTADLADKTLKSVCTSLAMSNSKLDAALTKVEPWKSSLNPDEAAVAATSLQDVLGVAQVLLKGSDAKALHETFKSAKQDCA